MQAGFLEWTDGGAESMEAISVTLDAVCLASRIILESGGETYRAEETVERMCRGLHIPQVDVFALPTGLMLTLTLEDDSSLSRIVRVRNRGIDLKRLDDCNSVSRKVAEGRMTAEEALRRLKEIQRAAPLPIWAMILVGAGASASFTVMLGGGWREFIASFLCGALVQGLLPLLSRRRVPTLLSGLVVGFLSTLLALTGTLCLPSLNIEPVISGAIMPMLPGLATTNAIRDTIRGDVVSGGARMTEAILTALMIAAGICIMFALWRGGAV